MFKSVGYSYIMHVNTSHASMHFFQFRLGMNAGSHPDPAHVLLLALTIMGFGPRPEFAFSEGAK